MGLVVNTLIYLPLTLWLLTVPYTGHSRERTTPARRPIRWRDAFEIVREASGNRAIITMVVLAGCVSFFVGTAFQATMPEFAHDLGTEKADLAYSALLGANAAGAVVGGFMLEGRGWLPPRVSTAMISAILWCLAITGFALSTSYYLSLLLLFTAGVLNLTFSSMGQTIVQLLSPPQLRGRLIGLFAMASLGLKAFSGLTVGVLGGLIGVHWSLASARWCCWLSRSRCSPSRFPGSSMGNSVNGPGVEASEIVQYESRSLARGICTCVGIPRKKMTTNPPPSASGSPALSKGQIAFAALRHRDYRRYFFVIMLVPDGRQHRARHQLLAVVPKISLTGAGGLCGHQSLDARSIFCGIFWRACRPSRLPSGIQAAQLMHAGVSLTWGILFLTDTIQVWHACVLLIIHGMAGVVGGPGSQLIIHDIVGREYLQSAVRLNSTGRNCGVLLGPAVGGATMLLFGPPMGLFINTLMFTPMFILMFILPYTGHGRDEA